MKYNFNYIKKKFDLSIATPICIVSKKLDKIPGNLLRIGGKYIHTLLSFN